MSLDEQSSVSRTTSQPEKTTVASYTPEEQVFHRLFPKIPLSEKLVESRQCALMTKKKRFARMGTLYASSLRICFYSSFLKDPVMMRWEDVASVEKGSSFLFEAIVVKTKEEDEFIFSGFLSGGTGQIFKLLKTLWTVRARYAFSELPIPLNNGLFQNTSVSLSYQSSETSSYAGDITIAKNEDNNSESSLSSSIKPITTEGSHNNPLNDDLENDSIPIVNLELTNEVEEKPRSPVLTPKLIANQDTMTDKFERLQYFPNIPKNEPLIDYFQCSYVSGVHRLGRFYITTNYILFSSLMMAEGLQISFKDVKSIEKEQTMMILDGIVIKLNNGETHSFTSFISRDAAFNILSHFFNVMKTQNPHIQELPRTIKVSNENSGFTTKTSEPDISKIPVVESINEFSKVLTDYGKALSNTSCFTKELIEPIKLPEGKTLIDVFKVCFDDNSTLLEQYHSDRKDTNQKWESWRPSLEGSPPFSGQRQFTCMTIIKALVAKVCPFTEYQRYAFMNIGGQEPTLLVQLSGQVEGVMFTDAFRVEALLVFSQTNSVVTMRAFGHVQFLRDVWVKGKILRTSLDTEMPDCYRKLGAMLIERLQECSGITSSTAIIQEQQKNSIPFEKKEEAPKVGSNDILTFVGKLLQNGNFFIGVLGLITCLNGMYTVYKVSIDKYLWQLQKGDEKIMEYLYLIQVCIKLFRPVVLSALSVGALIFFRFITGGLFSPG